MPVRTHVGVSLGPESSRAVVVRGGGVLATPAASGDDPGELFARAAAACPGPPAGVVVDLSGVLVELVLRRPAELARVAMIRVVPRAASDPALGRHPDDVIERLIGRRYTVPGGHDLCGRELRPLDRAALRRVVAEIEGGAARCVAVVAAGSPAQPRHEREVADTVQSAIPDARISAAHEFGGQGLVHREATVVLNAALDAAAERVLDGCERAAARAFPGVPFHVARGDGGRASASRMRALPVTGLGAADALRLVGAATLAGEADCRVVFARDEPPVFGDVRGGLAVVRPQAPPELGTVLVTPTAALTRADPARLRSGQASGLPVIEPDTDPDVLGCVGATASLPTAWLDEVAFLESAAELERIRRDALARATVLATANGAAPGSTSVVEVATVAVPYSPSGMVRIRVRVAGSPEPGRAP
ncbi:hydantoinase/oxoprolinase N-terminal domain-containing protein [Pseudonocardia acaciae]|uniref:hydantoinase/oxoprolinase N-terminal domain-containing protein n=1 Tax=Pseudonocardia acaciae TaxID=551276 RepID=UPI00048B6981|nr:hydantoinase/oxoprolinase N-terminal domain-containing protein [Pseudonocardia acaciae]